ncbi:hypothetical protein BGW41_000678 [Actinomortierella wolfii]|nr:hypothetical protein BGW41_000678 [Actinomortierella wolfii]
MSSAERLFFPPGVSTAELSKVIQCPSHIKVRYFELTINALTSQYLLACGNVSWESTYAGEDWLTERNLLPFRCLPILEISSGQGKDGQEVVLAETSAIEHYLANLFGMMGDNDYEKYMIMAFHSSAKAVMDNFATYCAFNVEEAKPAAYKNCREKVLPQWVEIHDKHLVRNGSNGHYVGDKFTLADLRTAATLHYFESQPHADIWMAIIRKSKALMTLKETVENHPPIAAYRATDEYKKNLQGTIRLFAKPSL